MLSAKNILAPEQTCGWGGQRTADGEGQDGSVCMVTRIELNKKHTSHIRSILLCIVHLKFVVSVLADICPEQNTYKKTYMSAKDIC
jgi:hypothetical protein